MEVGLQPDIGSSKNRFPTLPSHVGKSENEELVADLHHLKTFTKKTVGRNPGNLGIQKSREFTPFPGIRIG